ncbi:MAG: helix-turn-helix domain-containing protein [Azonexus sp.]|jgi:transcriptional regulator with XRE-family HTH domain|nr:helix-turn-helix domain-containing protein [Azonexus sp.]
MSASLYHSRYQLFQSGLAALRKQAALSQVQLAERLGLGQSFISKIERGDAYIELTLFVDWCLACGVRPGVTLDALVALEPQQAAQLIPPRGDSS